jgi:hypothetical protein
LVEKHLANRHLINTMIGWQSDLPVIWSTNDDWVETLCAWCNCDLNVCRQVIFRPNVCPLNGFAMKTWN